MKTQIQTPFQVDDSQLSELAGRLMVGTNYDEGMETFVKTIRTSDEAEMILRTHQLESHPEIQCQCLECLWAREILAQLKVWKQIQ
jgi:hypothetical protein